MTECAAIRTLHDEIAATQARLNRQMELVETLILLSDEAERDGISVMVRRADRARIEIPFDFGEDPKAGNSPDTVSPSAAPLAIESEPTPSSAAAAVASTTGKSDRVWCDADIAALRRMRQGGQKIADIAMELDRSEQSVKAKLHALSLTDAAGLPPAKARPAPWSAAEDDTAVRMYREGATVPQIAAAVGRPRHGTSFRLKKLRDRLKFPARASRPKPDLKVSPSPRSMRPSPPDQANPPAAADAGREGQGGAAAADQSGAAPRPEQSLQAKPVSAGTVISSQGLTIAQREIATRLDGLPFGSWTAEDDLDLVEAVVRGTKMDAVAADLERARADCLARWRDLCPNPGPQVQADLLTVLRRWVAAARGQG